MLVNDFYFAHHTSRCIKYLYFYLQQELPKSTEPPKSPTGDRGSTSSSRESTPEVQRRKSNNSVGYRNHVHTTGATGEYKSPPVAAVRGAPPPIPARMPSTEITTIKLNNGERNSKTSLSCPL